MRKWIFVCLTNFITLSIILFATIVSGCAQNDLPNSIPNPGTVGERLDEFIQPYVDMGVFNGTVLVAAGDYILVSKREYLIDSTPSTESRPCRNSSLRLLSVF